MYAQEGQAANTERRPAEAAQPTAAANAEQTPGMQNAPSRDIRKSNSFTNTGLQNPDADIRAGYESTLERNPEAGDYQVKHNADTRATAQARTETPERVRAEFDYLMGEMYPSMIVGGFTTVTITSVIIAGLFTNLF